MKKLTKLLSLILVFALALSVVACSSFGKVEKVLKEDGYILLVDKLDAQKQYEKVDGVTKVHTFTKSETIAGLPVPYLTYVIEFKSTDKMIKYFNENETLKGLIKDLSKNDDVKAIHAKLEKAGVACDNCLIITTDKDVYEEISDLND